MSPAISGVSRTVLPGTITPGRAVGLSGWFAPPGFGGPIAGVSGTVAVGNVLYTLAGSYDWLLVTNADRLVDWSQVGAWDGAVRGIPDTSAWTVINVKTAYGAHGDGVSDDTVHIQNAINAAPQNSIIYFPEGTYVYTYLNCAGKNRMVLRGDGATKTTLLRTGAGTYSIYFNGEGTQAGPFTITSGATKGSTSMVLSSVTGLAVGNTITVYPALPAGFPGTAGVQRLPFEATSGYATGNPGTPFPNLTIEPRPPESAGYYYGWSWNSGLYPRATIWNNCQWYEGFGQLVEITGINGTTVSFKESLYYNYTSYSPRVVKMASFIKHVGVEDLKVEHPVGSAPSAHSIFFKYVANGWVKRCEIKNTTNHAIYVRYSRACEFSKNYIHHGVTYASGMSYLMSFADYNSDHYVYDNIIQHGRHNITFEGGGQGCVVGYNYSMEPAGGAPVENWLHADVGMHGRHPFMNLFEGNLGARFDADNIHGGSSHNVIFRNWWSGRGKNDAYPAGITNARNALTLQKNSIYYSIIGNVLGYPGCAADGYIYENYTLGQYDRHMVYLGSTADTAGADYNSSINPDHQFPWPMPKATALMHGNYDYADQATKWDAGIVDHSIPDSLYLDAKPDWFGSSVWPPVGPDVSGMNNDIPAKVRWDRYLSSADLDDLFDTREGFVINHLNTDIADIPDAYITAAKASLHIGYGTASHGSQIVFGMAGIDTFLGTGTKYAANNGGSGGALDWRAYVGNFGGLNIATSIELDHVQSTCHTCWDTATRTYLPAHPEVNVIMWAWCWGLTDGTTWAIDYLARMEQLELDFPNVTFVYMTGRTMAAGAYVTGDQVGNAYIRNYCIANNKVLYDFNDIESYDPDGVLYGYPKVQDEAGAYDSNADGVRDSNWMTAWQTAHPGQWFNCESPHSQPITANQKAYAAWHLWARLAGWAGP